jgi:hypothetical protein
MEEEPKTKISKKYLWLIYISLIASAIMLLGDGLDVKIFARLTTRLGASVLLSALFLVVGRDKPAGIIATAIIWIAFIITVFN